MFSATTEAIRTARKERRSGNLPEVILWRALKMRPGGFKFRRQYPINRYSLDFACLSARLVIEVDGEIHSRGDQPGLDQNRDAHLERLGFHTLRIPARDVLQNPDNVVKAITAACVARQPLHQPAAGPPPHIGEVFGSLS
ncbi:MULTISPECIES: endonuclease domain-containing protein [Sphingobium]|uniref:DUF559 domain-containing protein n=1 Tax=Sphingobium fuliginis (strain ATCC 27551) TaxID=336203 RepID=A0A7M2GIS4_SPHSA|nr:MULTISPECIES: DUF559 domain-containing protein [Sphingobium]QOT72002.1 DUF559 domain-containing protein [Sphingobium fuliginis]